MNLLCLVITLLLLLLLQAAGTSSSSLVPIEALASPNEQFGQVVALSDSIMAVGVPGQAVHVYQLQPNTIKWKLLDSLTGECQVLALDPPGHWLAVSSSNHIQFYALVNQKLVQAQQPIELNVNCQPTSLQLSRQHFLVVSCPDYESSRGQVQVFALTLDLSWVRIVQVIGEAPGDRLGAHALLDDEPQHRFHFFRLAVSSPGYNDARGRVQVLDLDLRHVGLQQAGELKGQMPGDLLGTSLVMSRFDGKTMVAVGSPGHAETRGQVIVAKLQQQDEWIVLAEYEGMQPGDLLGAHVAMTTDAMRVAATSRNTISLFERRDQNMYQSIANITAQASLENVELSGGLVVAGSNGTVLSFVDLSPFCSQPNKTFLERRTCHREGVELVQDPDECAALNCVWHSYTTFAPSPSPSISPTLTSSVAPSWTSMTPTSQGTESPSPSSVPSMSAGPTQVPSEAPSQSEMPSTAPSQSVKLSMEPSVPTIVPSVKPSVSPTIVPSTEPSVSPTIVPTQVPSQSPTSVEIDGCRCDSNATCLDDPLPYGVPLLLCITMIVGPNQNLNISRLDLEQNSSRVIVHDASDVTLQVANKNNEDAPVLECSDSECRIEIPAIPSLFFQPYRPDYLLSTGWITLDRQTASYHFTVNVPLELLETNTTTIDDESPESQAKFSWKYLFLWISLVLLMLACCCYRLPGEKAGNRS